MERASGIDPVFIVDVILGSEDWMGPRRSAEEDRSMSGASMPARSADLATMRALFERFEGHR